MVTKTEDLQSQFAHWIGRQIERQDIISDRLIEQFQATFGDHIADQVAVPPGIFWCLSPDALTSDKLGGDGHPKLGIYLPEIPYPRRMWAGGSLRFHGQFERGQTITKQSTISNIAFKSGRSGDLCFVTVTHHYRGDGHVILEEDQNIVYRAEITPVAAASEKTVLPDNQAETLASWSVHPDTVMMFRYSALTFNGHRIHYDKDYSMGEERHPGLVVHGPMQATWLLSLATSYLGHLPSEMSYRGTAAYIQGAAATVALASSPDQISDQIPNQFRGMVVTAAGMKTMDATFKP